MITLSFEKLYKSARLSEPCTAAVPLEKGLLKDEKEITILTTGGAPVPVQSSVTSRWEDGSVRWLLVRFLADLPGNAGAKFALELSGEKAVCEDPVTVQEDEDEIVVGSSALSFALQKTGEKGMFRWLKSAGQLYTAEQFVGPCLLDDDGNEYHMTIERWKVLENGPVQAKIKGIGKNLSESGSLFDCELELTVFAGKPWMDVAYRFISCEKDLVHIARLYLAIRPEIGAEDKLRTCVANSNYKTEFEISEDGASLHRLLDGKYMLFKAYEHIPEVFFGTMFADWNGPRGGVCATVYQAQQNFPKAVASSRNGLEIDLVPAGAEEIIVQPGMARQQRVQLHFHTAEEPMSELDSRSLIYQMPDRPMLAPQVYQQAKVFPDTLFVEKKRPEIELHLIGRADHRAKGFGMLNWGDAPDMGYTSQGRGKGNVVWTNNEYDFPHGAAMLYVRTGTRRFLDYMLVGARHWMDVDVCHYSEDPLRQGGQVMHINGHVIGGKIICSHQWVEGLLDYYHFTGDKTAYETAIGIGENVLRLLATPEFQKSGETSARETGWALRTMVALYQETGEQRWLEKCDWIVGHFADWENTYGHWLAPYTDNTTIRVPFMISIAIVSLMRYYRVDPQERIKGMILRAVDDLLENCITETGLFYYKELPSLTRQGSNPIILEALSIAYELSGDIRYLEAGLPTWQLTIQSKDTGSGGGKTAVGDAVLMGGPGPKGFAQSFPPVMAYYKTASEAGLI